MSKRIWLVVALGIVCGVALGLHEKLRWPHVIASDEITVLVSLIGIAVLATILSNFERTRRVAVRALAFAPAALLSFAATISAIVGIWPWTTDPWIRFGELRKRAISVPWSYHGSIRADSGHVLVSDQLDSCGQKTLAFGMRADIPDSESPTYVTVSLTAAVPRNDQSPPVIEVLTSTTAGAVKREFLQCDGERWVAVVHDDTLFCNQGFVTDAGPPTGWQEITVRCRKSVSLAGRADFRRE